MNKHTNTLYCLIIMLTIWCTWNSANSGKFLSKLNEYRVEMQLFQREVASLIDSVDALQQEDIIREIETTVDEVQTEE